MDKYTKYYDKYYGGIDDMDINVDDKIAIITGVAGPLVVSWFAKLSYTLAFLFLILKLIGNIVWSWWWVFSPLWVASLLLGFTCFSLYKYYKKEIYG